VDSSTGSSLLSEIAALACDAPGRHAFRDGVLDRLTRTLHAPVAVFATVPPLEDRNSVSARNVGRRWVLERWHRTDLLSHLRPSHRRVVVPPDQGASLLPVEGLPVCLVRGGARVPSVLALARPRPFSPEELGFLEQLQPVLELGEERQLEVSDTVRVQLSPREREIFEYLVRGFRNEDIARALGTSPATVRNQLVRLYRKAGVATRSELVGLATSRLFGSGLEPSRGAA